MSEQFEDYQVGAGSAKCIPAQASSLRKGGHVLIKDKPCKIINMTSSKVGKHGHAKVHLVGLDIFDGKRHETNCPSSHNMSAPLVDKNDLEIVSMSYEGYFSLMTDKGELKTDVKYNPDLCAQSLEEIQKMIQECEEGQEFVCKAHVLSSMDIEAVKEVKKVRY